MSSTSITHLGKNHKIVVTFVHDHKIEFSLDQNNKHYTAILDYHQLRNSAKIPLILLTCVDLYDLAALALLGTKQYSYKIAKEALNSVMISFVLDVPGIYCYSFDVHLRGL